MPLRAAVVSRYLKAHGFERSESHTTMVRGWHNYSSGFRATQYDDVVRVEYIPGSFGRLASLDEAVKYELSYLKRVIEALDGKYRATLHEDSLTPYVVVTK